MGAHRGIAEPRPASRVLPVLRLAIVALLVADVAALGSAGEPPGSDGRSGLSTADVSSRVADGNAGVPGSPATTSLATGGTGVEVRDPTSGAPRSEPSRRAGAPGDARRESIPAANAPSVCTVRGCESSDGVTDSTIKIGVTVQEGGDEALASFGIPLRFGNGKRQVLALLDEINRRGGIAGRKITAHFVTLSQTSTDPRGDMRRACVEFTEDAKVFMVIDRASIEEFVGCVARHRVPLISGAGFVGDEAYLREVEPWVVQPSLKGESRMWRTLIPTLLRLDFFGRSAKIGLLVADAPVARRLAANVVKPMLGRAGLAVVDEFQTDYNSDLQSQTAQAVLRFKGRGVTHVLFIPGVQQSALFMQHAENQQYRPRYAIETMMFPSIALDSAAVPRAQLRNSVGIGWRPQFDMKPAQYPPTPREQRCLDLMRRSGEPANNRNDPNTAVNYCDSIWAFDAAASRAGRNLTRGSFLSAMRSLGTAHQSVLTFVSDFGRGTPDAAYAHRVIAWDEQCPCFRYRSGVLYDVTT